MFRKLLFVLTAYLAVCATIIVVAGRQGEAVTALYNATVRIVNSSGTVINGTASATSASYNQTVRVVDSTGHVIDSFGGGGTAAVPITSSGTSATISTALMRTPVLANQNGATSNFTLSLPAGESANDLLYCWQNTTNACSTPAGYTLINDTNYNGAHWCTVKKTAAGSDSGPTFTSPGASFQGGCTAFFKNSGVTPTIDLNNISDAFTNNALNVGPALTFSASDLIFQVAVVSGGSSCAQMTPITNVVQSWAPNSTAGNPQDCTMGSYYYLPSPGTYVSLLWYLASTSVTGQTLWTIAVN